MDEQEIEMVGVDKLRPFLKENPDANIILTHGTQCLLYSYLKSQPQYAEKCFTVDSIGRALMCRQHLKTTDLTIARLTPDVNEVVAEIVRNRDFSADSDLLIGSEIDEALDLVEQGRLEDAKDLLKTKIRNRRSLSKE